MRPPPKRGVPVLYEILRDYALSGVYPMHMPGHKRNTGFLPPGSPCDIDITEIHGFDDLHEPHGLLLEISGIAEQLYGSAKAYPLVNGSTVGILAAIGALTERGDKVLIPGNSHRSVKNAASLFGLEPVAISPETDAASGVPCSLSPAAVEASLEAEPGIKLVVVTSPTYEGVISDTGSISVSEISNRLCIAKPNITPLVDRLVEDRLVDRVRDTLDRRVVNIVLLDAGQGRQAAIQATMGEQVQEWAQSISLADPREMVDSLATLNRIFFQLPKHD